METGGPRSTTLFLYVYNVSHSGSNDEKDTNQTASLQLTPQALQEQLLPQVQLDDPEQLQEDEPQLQAISKKGFECSGELDML